MLAALVGLAAVLTSCSVKEEINNSSMKQTSKVCVNVRTFDLEQSDIPTRASESVPPHRLVFKALDSDGNTAWETVQTAGSEGFGTVQFELSPGDYTFVAVAHDLSSASLADDFAATISSSGKVVFPEANVYDSFCGVKTVTVLPSTDFSAGMSLPRVNSYFRITLNDAIPAGTKQFKLVVNSSAAEADGNPEVNPANGLALEDRQYERSFDISASKGMKGVTISANMFLTDVTQEVDVTASAYDADGNLISRHVLLNVPMKQNRMTVASGNFFTASGGGSFTYTTEWEQQAEISY